MLHDRDQQYVREQVLNWQDGDEFGWDGVPLSGLEDDYEEAMEEVDGFDEAFLTPLGIF